MYLIDPGWTNIPLYLPGNIRKSKIFLYFQGRWKDLPLQYEMTASLYIYICCRLLEDFSRVLKQGVHFIKIFKLYSFMNSSIVY